ncbi:choice-of-anchor M domain-containing protein [Cellulosimicrobium sp. PMB13]|uniref:choice-of-anchor M domain-containing protein n=1 Tax=Cellulosimicrobium sp. PMB13 TaxID=3120158 RepID=UPI003F4C52CD
MTPRPLLTAVALSCALLAGTLVAGPAAAVPATHSLPADTQDEPGLQQRVGADEMSVEGREVVTQGHLDIGPRFLDGTWTLQARDDRVVPAVWRAPEQTVLHVLDDAILPAPDSPDFAFLGVDPGAPLYVVPQVQNQDVVWIGWNTQDPEVTQRIDRGATLRLDGVEGPGAFHLFLQEGVTGPPNVLWSSDVDAPQDLWMEVNTHVHANWVFTEPGVYTFDVTVLADLADGSSVEDAGVLRFAVGTATDPQTAFAAADETQPEAAEPVDDPTDVEPSEPAAPDDASTADTSDAAGAGTPTSTVALWVGLAVVVLLAAVVVTVLHGRRARAAAEREADSAPHGDAS